MVFKHFLTVNIRLNINIGDMDTNYCGMRLKKKTNLNADLMTGYFLYSKTKMRGSTLYVTKSKIFKSKHIYKEIKTIKHLRNRKQRITLNGKSSSWTNVNAGVPQGSILGPLFFFSLY